MGQHKPNLVQILNVDIVECWGGLLADVMNTATAPVSLIVLLVLMIHQTGDSSATVGATYIIPVTLLTILATRFGAGYWRPFRG